MKKFLLLTIPLLVSCVQKYGNYETLNDISTNVSEEMPQEAVSERTAPSVKIPNEKCMDMERFKVVQVFQNRYALAFHCDDGYCLGTTVLLAPQKDIDYYDNLRVKPPVGRCAQQDGVFRYENKQGDFKTVPVIRWGYKYEAENKEESLKRLKELTDEAIDECKQSHILDKTDTSENMKKCECVIKEAIRAGLKNENYTSDEIEKKCSNNKKTKKKGK